MKYIFLFVNPTAGGNRASMFTDFGVNDILFHKPHKCHFSIYNILEGEHGKKPGFLRLSSVTNSPPEAENKSDSVTLNLGSPLSKSSLSVEGKSDKSNRNSSNTPSQNRTNETSNNTGIGGKNKGEEGHDHSGTEKSNDLQKTGSKNSEGIAGEDENICAYVLVAGGDGTLNWFLKEAEHYDIKDDKIAVGVIPFGTGNDFAKAFGWKKMDGFFNYTFLFDILKKIVDQAFRSKIEKHDYWNVHVMLKEDGYFNKISSTTKKKETLTENEQNVKVLKLCMSNYFSIGIDSRIGRGFERHRQKSAFFNKLIYVIEGFKKILFKKNIPVNLIIDKMVTGKNYDNVIFTTSHNDSVSPSPPVLKKAMSIICVNIPSYSSGNDIWNYTHKIGLKLPKDLPLEQKKMYKDLKKKQQEVGDGVLEFVIYQSGVDLGLEFTLKGRAFRVHQGIGPWKILFKEQVCNVYFQVDGEYYLMSSPESISIDHYKKINVLKNMV
ncbi:diacylglycerol kinase, putative [Plasmodium knowlesi strain H]|uniref:Diacylglycerol kinase n=3 Tax=Plasmodium knowlesi TaxID=5850 RepID=A0A5K1UST2_PLAKH|nr:diacylglycerol kinase, putative [Plasmodium knowlesi strain H]OTN65581.1 Diacylglycerol kinase [Plasmodium knowlesi]CAA9989422.1 diacylglycerol kinase, putative [Plasmodium knowlesi strain H]SBO25035.1 diacylglycerol kinase, putative [Plasmodium knowlesi strain H]SBO27851.1 diacylglycerol kinase, putative [Plasmodium knowlesi strain H]VVS78896.1 diacylglycerol kinase, putative [Plasmodium knowlesi strain H]|eukprot:XP_002260149.1 diacylglycerol kinase, putative [Plasmodium knowlesi strain H]